jgi:hypothetical protein
VVMPHHGRLRGIRTWRGASTIPFDVTLCRLEADRTSIRVSRPLSRPVRRRHSEGHVGAPEGARPSHGHRLVARTGGSTSRLPVVTGVPARMRCSSIVLARRDLILPPCGERRPDEGRARRTLFPKAKGQDDPARPAADAEALAALAQPSPSRSCARRTNLTGNSPFGRPVCVGAKIGLRIRLGCPKTPWSRPTGR